MKKRLIFLITAIGWLSFQSFGQGHKEISRYRMRVSLDTVTLDTFFFDYETMEDYAVSKEGIELYRGFRFGGMGTRCGCEPARHGFWTERYRNGQLKSTGTYDCEIKSGLWTYFYDNGQVAKIETWEFPYPSYWFFADVKLLGNVNFRFPMLSGAYAEFFPTGRPKITGTYALIEKLSPTDSISVVDTVTYEVKKKALYGNFWIAESVKTGNWRVFDENGEDKSEYFNPIEEGDTTRRPIAARFINAVLKEKKD